MSNLNELLSGKLPALLKKSLEDDYLMNVYLSMSRVGGMSHSVLMKMDNIIDLPVEKRYEKFQALIKEFESKTAVETQDSTDEETVYI